MKKNDKKIPYEYAASPKEYAAIYARRSTLMENNSIESQIEIAKKKIKENNLFLYNVYSDKESATKYTPIHRPGFKQLLYDAKNGKFKTIVVFRRDRLARKVDDLIQIKNTFKELGINLVYSNDGEFQPSDNYISSFIENIITSVDELEPAILAERIAAGKRESRVRGTRTGKAPKGYILVKDKNDKSQYNPKSNSFKNIVSDIFNKFIKVNSQEDMYKLLIYANKLFKEELNETLGKQAFKEFLKNPVYAALIKLDPKSDVLDFDETENFFVDSTNTTKCISKKTYFEALKVLIKLSPERERIINDEDHLFKGFIFCKKCSKPLHLNEGYYQCVSQCTRINKDYLDDILLRKIIKDVIRSSNIKGFQLRKKKLLEDEMKLIEKNITKIKDNEKKEIYSLLDKYNSNDINSNCSYIETCIKDEKKELDNLNKKKEETLKFLLAVEEIENIETSDNILNLILHFEKTVNYSHLILKNIIKKIEIRVLENEVNDYGKPRIKINYK